MCLIALAIDQSRRFPLVIAANRDEFFHRQASRLSWWSPGAGRPDILSGRDLHAGGTWLGLTAQGRLGMLTNVRNPSRMDPQAPSRGNIVVDWLAGDVTADRFWMRTALAGYNGFNLIAADFQRGDCFWASNHSDHPKRLDRGLYGLSNALLDTSWPKVETLKDRLRESLKEITTVEGLATQLFDALGDRSTAEDAALPQTGISLEMERVLSSAFIRTADGAYGTRCSTLIITERVNKRLVTHVLERTFNPGGLALLRRSMLKNWPPRYSEAPPSEVTSQEAVTESEDTHMDATTAPPRKTRVRTLLKPDSPRRKRSVANPT